MRLDEDEGEGSVNITHVTKGRAMLSSSEKEMVEIECARARSNMEGYRGVKLTAK